MKALILAAGLGTRLRPLTDILPKCLMPIKGVPLLFIWLDILERNGIRDVTINAHHMASELEKALSEAKFNLKIEIVHEQVLAGTAGTLRAYVKKNKFDDLLVIHGDNFCSCRWDRFFEAHFSGASLATIMTFDTESPSQCGIVTTTKDGILESFVEKPPKPSSNRANAAIYLFNHRVLESCLFESDADISIDILQRLIGKALCWHNDDTLIDIGTPIQLAKAQRHAIPSIDLVISRKNRIDEVMLSKMQKIERILTSYDSPAAQSC